MPMKLLKTADEERLVVQRVLHAKRYSLALDRARCPGCGVCAVACPREAITVKRAPKAEGEGARRPVVDIDEQRCQYCGICEALCPFGALDHRVDGKPWVAVVESESFPRLVRDIVVDAKRCEPGCDDCEEACPLKLITVNVRTPEGEVVEDVESRADREGLTVTVDVETGRCPCCRLCEVKCPHDAIHVEKIFQGTLRIHPEKCPEGCRDCVDICPITGALYPSGDGKVYVNELFCVYCGACQIVCPVEGALELQRTHVHHTPVRSGAWNKALEKLASTREMSKELRAKGLARSRESVGKRLVWKMG